MVALLLAHGADPTPLGWDELLANLIKFGVTTGMVLAFAAQIVAPHFRELEEKRRQEILGWAAIAAFLVLGMGWWLTRQSVTEVMTEENAGKHEVHLNSKGGQVAMWGDYHAEVMRLVSGEYRLFLTDAYRRPIGNEHFTAQIAARRPGEPEQFKKMDKALAGGYLFALLGPEDRAIAVKVGTPGWEVRLVFEFDESRGKRSLPLWCGTIKR